jgi:hypothetical protein
MSLGIYFVRWIFLWQWMDDEELRKSYMAKIDISIPRAHAINYPTNPLANQQK